MDTIPIVNRERAAVSGLRPIDYQVLSLEILREMRGNLTQRELSQRLGYTFNQVGKWESGASNIKWDDFLSLASALEIPVEKHFHWFFHASKDIVNPEESIRILITGLALSPAEWPGHSFKSWLKGETLPAFFEVLKIMDSKPGTLFGWLSLLFECAEFPSVETHYIEYAKRLDAVFSDPVCIYVNAALNVEEYQTLKVHNEKTLSRHATCSVERLRDCLYRMLACGIIAFDGAKYISCPQDFSFSSSRNPKLRLFHKYTADLVAARYPVTPLTEAQRRAHNPSHISTRVAAMSAMAAQKVVDLSMKFHYELGKIVAEDKDNPKDNVQIVTMLTFASTINSPEEK